MKKREAARARYLGQLRHVDLLAYLYRRDPGACRDTERLAAMSRDALLARALGLPL